MSSKPSIPFLRLLLLLFAAVLIVFPWLPGTDDFRSNEVSLNLMAPITMPVLTMLLLLDAVMLAVYRSSSDDEQQNKLWGFLIRLNLIFTVLLIASWVPFFVRLNS
ncbi:MAG: hypothetical protein DRQ60_00295 [Gammaproteobacteria bacterium]|nr:MAG: hypothetical protein DRQ54_01315 [Gammaproteobacteria bacterium]RLA18141.1 MAG: hypothetical protein DRQ60_00295 [Gammaproteobacteria bacterium]